MTTKTPLQPSLFDPPPETPPETPAATERREPAETQQTPERWRESIEFFLSRGR